jgi:hypothetical protein
MVDDPDLETLEPPDAANNIPGEPGRGAAK